MGEQRTFTVFTPTFNHTHTLPRVYESLCAQTYRDFDWLIVDDGSTDGTADLVARWQQEVDFRIRYIWKENGGAQSAHNRAMQEELGRFYVAIGSDDACVATALERLLAVWNSIPVGRQHEYAFVTALCRDSEGNLIGDKYPLAVQDGHLPDIVYVDKVRGDKWGFVVSDILREYPFPVLSTRTSHIPEGVIWMRIGARYLSRCVNESLLIVHLEPGSLSRPDGGSSRVARRIAPGFAYYYRQMLSEQARYALHDPESFARAAIHYVRFSFHNGTPVKQQWQELEGWRARLLYAAGFVPGAAVYLYDRGKLSRESRVARVDGVLEQMREDPARFAFGANWRQFLSLLDEERIADAEASLRRLLQLERLDGLRFLDIGSGSGLFSLAARRLGATVHSFDYDAESVACTAELRRRYFPDDPEWVVEQGSVLETPYLRSLGQYDVVYSWGVLHHTGSMWQAMENVSSCVRPGGRLAVALYNRRPSSPRWWKVKETYNRSGIVVRALLVWGYYSAHVASRLLKGQSPFTQRRGMSLYHDVVDWVGGFPYEYASHAEVVAWGALHGLALLGSTQTNSVGCNEYLFFKP